MLDNQAANLSLTHRAEKAEKDLESALKASEQLARKVQTTIDLLKIFDDVHGFNSNAASTLIGLYLRDALDAFDTWDDIPF